MDFIHLRKTNERSIGSIYPLLRWAATIPKLKIRLKAGLMKGLKTGTDHLQNGVIRCENISDKLLQKAIPDKT